MHTHTQIPKDTAVVTKMKLLLSNVNGLISAITFKGRILFLLFPFKHVAIFEQTMNKERRRKICIRRHQNKCMAEIQIKALYIYKHSIGYTVTMVKLRLFVCHTKGELFPLHFHDSCCPSNKKVIGQHLQKRLFGHFSIFAQCEWNGFLWAKHVYEQYWLMLYS